MLLRMATPEDRLAPHKAAIAAAEAHLADLRRARDAEILACLADHHSPSLVARAAGLSRRAIYDIRDAGRLAP